VQKFRVIGPTPLSGRVAASGSKNSALPALAASLLTEEPVTLRRIPQVKDIQTMQTLLRHTGASVEVGDAVQIHAATLGQPEAPYEVVKTMRASSLVLGPLVARCGRARVSMPGGCAIGARPINLHVAGLEHLGAEIRQEHGYIEAVAEKGLRGSRVRFDRITVTGTEDLLMAATLAEGETVLENAAREPEVVDLAMLLRSMGAQIEGEGTPTIRIHGVKRLHGTDHTIIPDRIEAGTFLVAGIISGGELEVTQCDPEHLDAFLTRLRQTGAEVESTATSVFVRSRKSLRSVDIRTEEHPGFATDLQAQFMALMTQASGISFITETIFENRFMHVPELTRMGANIRIEGRQAIVAGPARLSGAQVMSSDLRASASLVLAALAAHGETSIDRVYHLDRGYENFDAKLRGAGAAIERLESSSANAGD
jgi:UDP-N-acetylglucosamine 1-carboxyvinyltransferase